MTDAAGLTATRDQAIAVRAASMPGVSIVGGADVLDTLQQPAIGIALGAPYPAPVTGQVTLTFQPDAAVPADDPAVQFATGGQDGVVHHPGQCDLGFGGIPDGIGGGHHRAQRYAAGGRHRYHAAGWRGAHDADQPLGTENPKCDGSAERGGVRVADNGAFGPTRELVNASVRLTPAPGADLQTPTFTIQLADVAGRWFQDPAGMQFGSQFTLVLPFTVQGDPSAIASATVTLSNQSGSSQAATVSF